MRTAKEITNYVVTVNTNPRVELHCFNNRAVIKGYAIENPHLLRRCCRLADDAKLDLEIDFPEFNKVLFDNNFFDIEDNVWLRVFMS